MVQLFFQGTDGAFTLELWQLLMLFGVGCAAGVINVMAGGGSSLTLPTLIFMGLDGATANGTNRVALIIQNIMGVWSFRREKVSRLSLSLKLAAWTLPGAVAGAITAVSISDEWFQKILGVILIGVVITMLLPRSSKHETTPDGRSSKWAYPAMVLIGFYGGFIQLGVGFLIMAIFYHLLRIDLVFTNMHKLTIVLIYMVPALFIFAINGNVNWVLGFSLAAGNGFGAFWAAKLAVKRGDKIIRYVLIVAVLIMAAKILGLF